MRATISFSLGDSSSSGFLGSGLAVPDSGPAQSGAQHSPACRDHIQRGGDLVDALVLAHEARHAAAFTWDSVSESVTPDSSSTLVPGYR